MDNLEKLSDRRCTNCKYWLTHFLEKPCSGCANGRIDNEDLLWEKKEEEK